MKLKSSSWGCVYTIFNLRKDGSISKNEMIKVIDSVFSLVQDSGKLVLWLSQIGWKADSHISEYFQAEMKEMSTAERVESIFRQMDEVRQLLFQFCNNFSSLYEIQSYPFTFRIKVESWARRSSSTAPEKTPQLLQHFHFTVEPDVVRTQTKLIRVVSNKISFYVDTRMTFWHNTTKHA